ncbi:alpha/beta hydrolase [Kineococcus gynurae]|uniref:Alpha/beta hydrolase n=1 Tax=Kineococcus gynurae TaxID=452979 RepID=A0ABV5LTC5_9ACTN
MTRLLDLDPEVASFSARPGSRTAVLVSHGFTASPQSVRLWAEAFAAAGFDVSAPRLPGHGTTVADCNTTTWADWLGALRAELRRLAADHDRVVVAGISMGGALCLRLAELHPEAVAGVVLANPAVRLDPLRTAAVTVLGRTLPSWPAIAGDQKNPARPVRAYDRTPLRALVSSTGGWRDTRRDLALVTQPVLLLRSRVDHVVPALSSATVLRGISSIDVTEVVFEESFHEITCDGEHLEVERLSVEFVRRLDASPAT